MEGQLRATGEFGRWAPEGFLTQWTDPGPYSLPDLDREPHSAPSDAGPPIPKRRREKPVRGDEAWGQTDPASWCWETGTSSLGPPGPAPGTPGGPQDPGLRISSGLGSMPLLWTPVCLRKPLERADQSSLEERQEPRSSLKQKEEKEIHSLFHVDAEKTGWFFLSEEETASPGFLEAEERELVTKKEGDWSSQQKLRDQMSFHFPSVPRKEDEVLSAYPKLDCFPKNEAESKSIDMEVQENHIEGCSPFALASSLNATRMERIVKTWQQWHGIPLEAGLVMGPLSTYPENPPWPVSVEFLDNPHTSPVYFYGNQNILEKNKWPHFISGSKTSGHLRPRCCQGA